MLARIIACRSAARIADQTARPMQTMRILAGIFRGRKLLSPPAGGPTRPITGGAKKSLFDTLAGRLAGAVVLDLYCGTGTMGLEALSRGAEMCCFAERDKATLARLRRNIDLLGVTDKSTIWSGDVERRLSGWLARLGRPVDIALVDPPYARSAEWDWPTAAKRLFDPLADALADDGLVVLRYQADLEVPDPLGTLAATRHKRYGDMAVTMLAKRAHD